MALAYNNESGSFAINDWGNGLEIFALKAYLEYVRNSNESPCWDGFIDFLGEEDLEYEAGETLVYWDDITHLKRYREPRTIQDLEGLVRRLEYEEREWPEFLSVVLPLAEISFNQSHHADKQDWKKVESGTSTYGKGWDGIDVPWHKYEMPNGETRTLSFEVEGKEKFVALYIWDLWDKKRFPGQ
jgi:hypothetical protein